MIFFIIKKRIGEGHMDDRKSMTVIVVLVLLVLGLGGFLVYDKVILPRQKENNETTLNNVSIDLNAFYEIGEILDRMDRAFHPSDSNYVGYLYKSSKKKASEFEADAAIFASIRKDLRGTQEVLFLPEGQIKKNFEKIFGNNLKYVPSNVLSGEYRVDYNKDNSYYAYLAPTKVSAFQPQYMARNMKTVLEEDKVLVTRKVFYVEYTDLNAVGIPAKANIHYDSSKGILVGSLNLKNGVVDTYEVVSKFGSKLKTYQYTFQDKGDNEYRFEMIESVK